MRSTFFLVFCFLVVGPASIGCNNSNNNNEVIQKIDMDFAANIKSDLEAIAKSGRLGSGTQTLLSNVRALVSKDPAKGEPIQKGINELIKLQGEAKIKAKAQELIKLL